MGLRGRSLDARAHEGVERNGAHSGYAKLTQGDLGGRGAFPQGGVLDIGAQKALPEKESVGAIGPGHPEPSLDPGFAERDVLAVEIGWHKIGVILGVQGAGQCELPELGHALGGGGSSLGSSQSRQEHSRETGDDCDHHQQLDQCETEHLTNMSLRFGTIVPRAARFTGVA